MTTAESELEDKCLRLQEENIELKKNATSQKEKIKRLGTKLLRLIEDKKRLEGGVSGRKDDIRLEEIIQDLQDQNRELTKQNKLLKEKLIVTKQQLATHSKRPPYNHISSRIDTGRAHPLSVQGKASPGGYQENRKHGGASPLPKYGLALLEEARIENKNMEEAVQSLREQMYILEQENDSIREQMKIKEANYSEEIANLKSQMTMGQRKSIQGNIDMIRFQRELKQKTSQLQAVEQDRHNISQNLELLKAGNEDLLADVDRLNNQLQDSQNKSLHVDAHLKEKISLQHKLQQCDEQIICHKKENLILKETNEKLMSSVIDVRPSKENNVVEQTLRAQVAKLQSMLTNDISERKSSPEHQIAAEEACKNNAALEELQKKYNGLMEHHDKVVTEKEEMTEKLKILSESSVVDMHDLEEALSVVKLNKELSKAPIADHSSLQKQVKSLEAQNVETANELEKTRNMLILQHRINCDYQAEVDAINQQKGQLQAEFETKIQEYAKLLDIRAARIQKLEFQLRDIAYGTKQYPIADAINDYEIDDAVQLERGQNILELHFDKVSFSSEALHTLQDREPSTFLTFAFYDYQLNTTPIIKGSRPEFNYTTQYIVRADDSFLEYLFKNKTPVELHVANGVNYSTIGICHLDFRSLLDDTHARYHGKTKIFSVDKEQENVVIAIIEFWVRLKIPMEQAVRLFKERGKALGYISVNRATTKSALSILGDGKVTAEEKEDTANELHIKLIRCRNIRLMRENHQPSVYCVYKWHESADYDTQIIPASNHPEFNDHNVIRVTMSSQLDDYLKTKMLQIYVFDDTDSVSDGYIGVANVPLISLIHNKAINGTFEICPDGESVCGTVDICIYFQYKFFISAGLNTLPQPPISDQIKDKTTDESQEPNTADTFSDTIIAGHASNSPQSKPQPKPRNSGPAAISTPIMPSKLPSKDSESHVQPRALRFMETGESESSPKKPSPPAAAPRHTNLKSRELLKEKASNISDNSMPSMPLKSTNEPSERKSPSKHIICPPKPSSSGKLEDEFKAQGSPLRPSTKTNSPVISSTQKVPTESNQPQELSDDESLDSMKEDLKNSEDNSPIVSSSSDKVEIKGEEVADNKGNILQKESVSASESDDIVVKHHPPPRSPAKSADVMKIVIHNLVLVDGSDMLSNSNIQMLFVEYKFLNFPPEELETPFALPKPVPGHKIAFHFHKVFHLDAKYNYQRRQMVAGMLLPEQSDIIQFTIVSEPPDDKEQEMDCEDVGYATVNLKQVLQNGDLKEEDVQIYDSTRKNVIGYLNVTVEAASVLHAIKLEMNVEPG